MTPPTIATGVVHTVPDDLAHVLTDNAAVLERWNALTSLARNEWICWLTIVKKMKPELSTWSDCKWNCLRARNVPVVGQAVHIEEKAQRSGLKIWRSNRCR